MVLNDVFDFLEETQRVNGQDARAGLGEVGLKKFGCGEAGRDVDFFSEAVEFAVNTHGSDAVCLESAEFVESFVGAPFEESGEFDEAFHLIEEVGVFGIVEPTVLCLDFEGLGALGLEGGEGEAEEGLLFELGAGEAFCAEPGLEGFVVELVFRVEEEFRGGGEAMADAVGCGFGATGGGLGAS